MDGSMITLMLHVEYILINEKDSSALSILGLESKSTFSMDDLGQYNKH